MAPPGQPPADAADARTYEPRPASERALRGLATWLRGPLDTAVVASAPGAGTTFVLRRLEAAERERRAVLFVPFFHIEPEALEGWLDGMARAGGHASLDVWLAPSEQAPLLLVDEAHRAPPAALDALVRLRAGRAPHLRVCLGGCAGPALGRAAHRLAGAGLLVLELPPWSEDDLRSLARALCASSPADPAALVEAAEGSPGLLRLVWSDLRDRGPAPLPAQQATASAPSAPVFAPAPEPSPEPALLEPALAAAAPAEPAFEEPSPEPVPPASVEPVLEAAAEPQAPPSEPPPVAAPPLVAAPPPVAVSPPPVVAPPPVEPAPAAVRIERAPVVAAPPPRRRTRVPWFHAAALVVGFGLGLAGGWQGWHAREPARVDTAPGARALAAVAAEPPMLAIATPVPLDVQINARPWAWIRIDGRAVGVTPLVQRGLVAGPHEFEATFPDGRQQRRTVEISPDARFVSFLD